MTTGRSKLSSGAIVLVSSDIEKTAACYRDIVGFRVVAHYGSRVKSAALYRHAVEIVLVQSNRQRDGAGYEAYLIPETVQAVDDLCAEIRSRGAKIVQMPVVTPYSSHEFAFKDILVGRRQTRLRAVRRPWGCPGARRSEYSCYSGLFRKV